MKIEIILCSNMKKNVLKTFANIGTVAVVTIG